MFQILDHLFSFFSASRYNFFHRGWGEAQTIHYTHNLIRSNQAPFEIEIDWLSDWEAPGIQGKYGVFQNLLTELKLPEKAQRAHVEMILPNDVKNPPVCIHFAATGEEGFYRRRSQIAIPLAKAGIGSILLENPYYGRRRPKDQQKFRLNYLTDQLKMVAATVEEGKALLHWLKKQGYTQRGVSGFSLGGYVSALVGSIVQEPLATIPCCAPPSGVVGFLEGILHRSCNWQALQKELGSEKDAKELAREIFEISDIRNYPPPPSLKSTVVIAGSQDLFVPKEASQIFEDHWKGCEMQWISTSHVGGYLFYAKTLREGIIKAFENLSPESQTHKTTKRVSRKKQPAKGQKKKVR